MSYIISLSYTYIVNIFWGPIESLVKFKIVHHGSTNEQQNVLNLISGQIRFLSSDKSKIEPYSVN